MGTVKDTTYEIIFDDSYPQNVPLCRHGPALKLKSIKRTNQGGAKTSEKWVCRLVLRTLTIPLSFTCSKELEIAKSYRTETRSKYSVHFD